MDTTTVKEYSFEWWTSQLDLAEKRLKTDWWNSADKIVKKFKAKKGDENSGDKTYLLNIFWANVGIMMAALYARPPKPMVRRTWGDMNDNIGRVAALILQRCLAFDFMKNNSPMDEAFKKTVHDRLIAGLGCTWQRYEMTPETVSVPMPEGQAPVTMEVISEEETPTDYVHWRDIVYPSARTWEEVWFVARKIYLTPSAWKKKLGKKLDKDASTVAADPDKILPTNFAKGKVMGYEIWCKRTNKVYWLTREVDKFLKVADDFLELDDFYPCPKFLLATHATDDFLPRPDYTMCRDQYEQLEELNTRCVILEKALRVVGLYDKKNDEVKRVLSDARENDMIPVEKWAVLTEGGGFKGAVEWFPIDVVAAVLEKLSVQKKEKINEIYELTGLSDILRGETNPRETLGAQEIKSQNSSMRLQYLQGQVSTFVREALVIKAQVVCKHCQPETIKQWSNIMQTPDAQYADQAIQLLQDSEMTEWRVDINEEGLALPDYNMEKQTRIEFLTTVGQFLSQAAPITAAMPGALPYLVQIVRWVASGMRGSDEIQGVLDQAINALQNSPPQAQGAPQPDPTKLKVEEIKQQGETQRIPMKMQADLKVTQTKADLAARNIVIQQKAAHESDLTQATQAHGHQIQQITHEAGAEDALAQAAARMKTQQQQAELVTSGMLQQTHAAHEFARAQRLAERDHQHAMELQAAAPGPTGT